MEIEDLAQTAGAWLRGSGPWSDIVISSRVRLARNLKDLPFLSRAKEQDRQSITDRIRKAIGKVGLADITYLDLGEISSLDRMLLVERHLISKELASGEGERGVAFGPAETHSLMINEEDHLRIQVLKPGLALEEAYREAMELDAKLERELPYAFSSQFGYLTVCPTNVGTGLRASIMVHLPALVFMKQIDKVFQAVSKINLAVRGLYGEGTQATGDFYQISNQVTLGQSEEGLIQDLLRVVPRIEEYERRSRELWQKEDRILMEDRVFRALGMLQQARKIASEETLDHLSAVRMGVTLGLVQGVDIQRLNELFVLTLPAHLQKKEGSELPPLERDIVRARLIRNRLGKADGS
ncbi:MAG: protein arginine kinase [Planctomycetota bacterium]|jgi:protein arginine kinase